MSALRRCLIDVAASAAHAYPVRAKHGSSAVRPSLKEQSYE